MEFFNDYKKLFITAAAMFIGLTILVAIIPAFKNEAINKPLPGAVPLSPDARAGKYLYIANGCVACHTQQVRNVDMDRMWGKRPSIAADYAGIHRTDFWRNTATLMGTERTGPDLTDVGNRQGNRDWNLVHLYNPRIVVKESVMPSYSWMFEIKENPGKNDVVVNVPAEYLHGKTGKVVAKKEALQLVAYLQSLKQTPLPDGRPAPDFLYKMVEKSVATTGGAGAPELDGNALYTANCQSCHQANGEGLPGAFPPLKGSSVVLADTPTLYVDIIMNGYSGLVSQGYGPMPNVGTMNNLKPEEITAIMNHERTSWGNNARKVTVDEVKKLIDFVKSKPLAAK